jgi:hypothetical protein
MANQIPLSGASNAAGGYLLPPEQGDILTQGLLTEPGPSQLAGDKPRDQLPQDAVPDLARPPTAGFVGEGAAKPVTGAEFGQGDQHQEDRVDRPVHRRADRGRPGRRPQRARRLRRPHRDQRGRRRARRRQANGTNLTTSFDNAWRATTNTVEYGTTKADALELAVSAAMGKLEANGYDPATMGVLLGTGFAQAPRRPLEQRHTARVYDANRDPLYGLPRFYSTNLNNLGVDRPPRTKIVGFVVYRRTSTSASART